jgi:predicted RNase H-like HicB family nuclease
VHTLTLPVVHVTFLGDMDERERIKMELYDLQITIEELNDSSDYRYVAASSDLPNLIVVGDTIEEALSLAPHVASALIASMKAAGDELPDAIKAKATLPFASRLMVAA